MIREMAPIDKGLGRRAREGNKPSAWTQTEDSLASFVAGRDPATHGFGRRLADIRGCPVHRQAQRLRKRKGV
jgi:hypothetical protein